MAFKLKGWKASSPSWRRRYEKKHGGAPDAEWYPPTPTASGKGKGSFGSTSGKKAKSVSSKFPGITPKGKTRYRSLRYL